MSNTDTTTTAPSPPAGAWHADVPAEILGKWQNKSYDLSDPKKVAIEATRAYMSAESLVGLPSDQLIRLPKTATEPGWDKVWQRLGAPADPKDYDFSGIKGKDGKELATAFVDTMRATAATLHLPKDAAAQIAKSVVEYNEKSQASELTEKQAKLTEQKAALQTEWGKNYDALLYRAKEAAGALGATKEQIDALQEVIGYDKVMNMFAKIATTIGEDKFVGGGPRENDGVMTKAQATEQLTALKKDKAWAARLLAGDIDAQRQSKALSTIIAGDDTEFSRQRSGR